MAITESGLASLIDLHPPSDTMEGEVRRGLRKAPKSLPPKLLYDERGSELFDRICELDDYYPTRTELAILREHIREMANVLGPRCALIEPGSGSSLKTQLLLQHLVEPAAYVPLDISKEPLLRAAAELSERFTDIEVVPVCADFMRDFELPTLERNGVRRIVYFPGSTIGNLLPEEARSFLRRIAKLCGRDGGLLIGVDLKKDPAILERAYNDHEGVTAAFNLNLLRRINRELGADFRLDRFRHRAFYNHAKGRVEMHLVSLDAQTVTLGDAEYAFDEGETIHTENAHKYTLDEFEQLAATCGLGVRQVWTDPRRRFSVQYLIAA